MPKVKETTQQLPRTPMGKLLKNIQMNTSYQVENNRTHQLITDIISQFKLLMEYLPDEDYKLDIILKRLTIVQQLVENNNIKLINEFEDLKSELIEIQTPCKCGGECP